LPEPKYRKLYLVIDEIKSGNILGLKDCCCKSRVLNSYRNPGWFIGGSVLGLEKEFMLK
jgi:hypothetical protein